jgi:putative glutamine amidotransferase
MTGKLSIGITNCSKYENYRRWVAAATEGIEIIQLDYHVPDLRLVRECDGIMLSGGEDVHPSMYNQPEYLSYCYADDINLKRDEFEWKVMQEIILKGIPVLGICRGLQFINVFFGGTLIPDLTTWGKFNHSKYTDGRDRYHRITIDPNSQLFSMAGTAEAEVNSNHHQSAGRIGKGLVVSAISADGTVEAIERKPGEEGSWLYLVQWHPERMNDQDSPMVKAIMDQFLTAAGNYRQLRSQHKKISAT